VSRAPLAGEQGVAVIAWLIAQKARVSHSAHLMQDNYFFRQLGAGAACALTLALMPLRADETLVPLKLKLPAPVGAGTPKNVPAGSTVELNPKPPPPLLVPKDVVNVAPGKKISCSDKNANAGDLAKLNDGDKEAEEGGILLLHKGLQWVQFDLGAPHEIFAIVIWHGFDTPKIYRSVLVQVADDADFTQNTRTLFNNDRENSAGFGIGADRQYFESNEGKIIDAKGMRSRFVRLYSNGNSDSLLNEYIEVEIYARPGH
jgi:hypothetical protein